MELQKYFKHFDLEKFQDNVFSMIEKDWMLLTAGNTDSFNTMTAAWGGLGMLWKKKVVFCFIRPQRYTYSFFEKNNFFTVSFYEEKYKEALNICGTTSGRNHDKIKAAGLTPISTEKNNTIFTQSRLFFECKKIYFDDIKPSNFLSSEIDNNYPIKDYHRMYVGEIVGSYECIK